MIIKKIRNIAIALVALAALSAIVMLLWNALIPGIFHLTSINFWQAGGLLILTRMLFGGIGRPGGMSAFGMHGHRNHIREKWMKMTPEEREAFMNERKNFRRGGFFDREHFGPQSFDTTTGQKEEN